MKSLVVTGGGHGIGEQICRKASAAGWRVGVLDLDGNLARSVAGDLPYGVALPADVCDAKGVERALDQFGDLDALVNNAGIVRYGSLLEISLADWKLAIDVNLTGTFIVGRAAARRMAAGVGGAIVNIASINGVIPAPNVGSYGTSKAGVVLLTEHMALEWAGSGIRVNSVSPGFVDAGMNEDVYADPETRRIRSSGVPLKRLGTPEDIADAVLFLLSDAASYVTGHNLIVDGGVHKNVLSLIPRPYPVRSGKHD